MKGFLLLGFVATVASAFAAPVIDPNDVVFTQNGAQEATVTYRLVGEPAIVTLDVQTNAGNGVWTSIGRENLQPVAGDVNRLVSETGVTKTIHWRPTRTWADRTFEPGEVRAVVKAWSTNAPPDYMMVDLTLEKGVFWYESEAELPYGSVTNDIYKTRMLVMRKIPAANVLWRAGTPYSDMPSNSEITNRRLNETPSPVVLTKDYYIGVYPMTVGQFARVRYLKGDDQNVTGDFPVKLPQTNVSWEKIRGTDDGAGWPDDSSPDAASALGWIRSLTGIPLDLPTEMQWEFACCGGMSTALYSGKAYTQDNVKELAWTKDNASALNEVGQKPQNGYGLYDMLGNCWEWVLDWRDTTERTSQLRIDPRGRSSDSGSGNARMVRGGAFGHDWKYTRCGFRNFGNGQSTTGDNRGYRLCWTLP